MVHEREGLPLSLEASDNILGVHAEANDLERDAAPDGVLLFGHVNGTASSFADLLEEFIATDFIAGLFHGREQMRAGGADWTGRFAKKGPDIGVAGEKGVHALTETVVTGAGLGEIGVAHGAGGQLESGREDLQLSLDGAFHGVPLVVIHTPMRNGRRKAIRQNHKSWGMTDISGVQRNLDRLLTTDSGINCTGRMTNEAHSRVGRGNPKWRTLDRPRSMVSLYGTMHKCFRTVVAEEGGLPRVLREA